MTKEMEQTTDYSAYSETTPTQDKMTLLAHLASQQLACERLVEKAEAALTKAKADLAEIAERQLPELMEELQLETFSTTGGITIEVGERIQASISKEHGPRAIEWLDAHGFARLVKRKFTVMFGKDEEKWANKFAADLARRKRQLNVERKAEVHPQTLKAFVKEQLEAGAELPLDLFGVFRQRVSKVEVK